MVSVKNITFKSFYNLFKINIHRLVRPLIAIFSPVQGHLNYYIRIIKLKLWANAFWQSGSDSRWVLGKKIEKTLMKFETPPPSILFFRLQIKKELTFSCDL